MPVIKVISRKKPDFRQAIHYFGRGARKNEWVLLWNLESRDEDGIVQEFSNLYHWFPTWKNGNAAMHIILSFHHKDRKELKGWQMIELGQEWLRLAAPDSLAYGQIHWGKAGDNPHLHLLVSVGTLSGKRRRMSQRQFAAAKLRLEAIQKERFPMLRHSFAQKPVRRRQEKRISQGEAEALRRNKKEKIKVKKPWRAVQREELEKLVSEIIEQSSSEREFQNKLKEHGLNWYCRGKTYGVSRLEKGSLRKYRLKTLNSTLPDRYKEQVHMWDRQARQRIHQQAELLDFQKRPPRRKLEREPDDSIPDFLLTPFEALEKERGSPRSFLARDQ
ncbi:MAG: relaxase/mobilization nuclease domain-containing protein [Magnetococcales bacterium]|nr:relaxase/mobilization nuclease domain-containing protein [Magnetococcales bacterium]